METAQSLSQFGVLARPKSRQRRSTIRLSHLVEKSFGMSLLIQFVLIDLIQLSSLLFDPWWTIRIPRLLKLFHIVEISILHQKIMFVQTFDTDVPSAVRAKRLHKSDAKREKSIEKSKLTNRTFIQFAAWQISAVEFIEFLWKAILETKQAKWWDRYPKRFKAFHLPGKKRKTFFPSMMMFGAERAHVAIDIRMTSDNWIDAFFSLWLVRVKKTGPFDCKIWLACLLALVYFYQWQT